MNDKLPIVTGIQSPRSPFTQSGDFGHRRRTMRKWPKLIMILWQRRLDDDVDDIMLWPCNIKPFQSEVVEDLLFSHRSTSCCN